MKKVFLNVFVFATIGMSMISCKNEAKNETEAKEAEEVTQASEEAVNFDVLTDESTIKWKGTKRSTKQFRKIRKYNWRVFLRQSI